VLLSVAVQVEGLLVFSGGGSTVVIAWHGSENTRSHSNLSSAFMLLKVLPQGIHCFKIATTKFVGTYFESTYFGGILGGILLN